MTDAAASRVTIGIGGDIAPILRNRPLFENADAAGLFDGLLDKIAGCDVSIANLETPLIRRENPIRKAGPVLGAPDGCVSGLKASGIGWLNLANNHIRDHGESGILNTIAVCREAELQVFGAGANLEEARRPAVACVKGTRVGLLGISSQGISIAGRNRAGANPIDPIALWRQLHGPEGSDIMIVLVHAGASGYQLPSPNLQSLCRYIVDLGANVVVCQHSHCPGALEEYNGALIVYGQGNLIFDWQPSPGGAWCEGFWLQTAFVNRKLDSYRLLPFHQSRRRPGLQEMSEVDAETLLDAIKQRNSHVASEEYIRKQWEQYCARNANTYAVLLAGRGLGPRLIRRLCDRIGIAWSPLSRTRRMIFKNLLMCEDHREVLETILSFGDER